MENIYSRRVLNFKNKYGSSVCAIAQEKNGGVLIVPKGIEISKSYAVTKDGQFTEGSKSKEGWVFPEKLDNISAVILGEFDSDGNLKPYSHVAYTGGAFEIRRNGFYTKTVPEKNENNIKEEKIQKIPVKQEENKEEPNKKTDEAPKEAVSLSDDNKKENMLSKDDILLQYEKAKNENWAEKRLKNIIKTFEKEMKELENIGVIKKEDIEKIEGQKIQGEKTAVDKLFDTRQRLYPFENNDYDWIAVSSNEIWRAGIKERRAVQNPLVMAGEIKYNHLALGRNKITGGLIFAVPEKFDIRDKKEAFDAGFKDFWFCCREKNDFGYWIMAI